MIFAHKQAAAVLRLANVILNEVPQSRIVIHYSAGSGPFPSPNDERISLVDPPATVQWCTFSQTDMMLRSLEHIRRYSLPDEWIVMLSGQCYPVRPLADLEAMLAGCGADAYMWSKRIEAHDRVLRDRYTFDYHRVADGPLPFPFNIRALRGVVNRLQPLLRVKSMPRVSFVGFPRRQTIFDLEPKVHFGSCWIALSRKAAQYIAQTVRDRPQLLEVFEATISAEESFFSTVVMNAPNIDVINADLHYIDWTSVRTGSPRTLRRSDLTSIERSGKWFARKIEPADDDGLRDALDTLRNRNRSIIATRPSAV